MFRNVLCLLVASSLLWTVLNSVKYYKPTQGEYFGRDSDIFTCVFVASNAPAVSDKLIFQVLYSPK